MTDELERAKVSSNAMVVLRAELGLMRPGLTLKNWGNIPRGWTLVHNGATLILFRRDDQDVLWQQAGAGNPGPMRMESAYKTDETAGSMIGIIASGLTDDEGALLMQAASGRERAQIATRCSGGDRTSFTSLIARWNLIAPVGVWTTRPVRGSLCVDTDGDPWIIWPDGRWICLQYPKKSREPLADIASFHVSLVEVTVGLTADDCDKLCQASLDDKFQTGVMRTVLDSLPSRSSVDEAKSTKAKTDMSAAPALPLLQFTAGAEANLRKAGLSHVSSRKLAMPSRAELPAIVYDNMGDVAIFWTENGSVRAKFVTAYGKLGFGREFDPAQAVDTKNGVYVYASAVDASQVQHLRNPARDVEMKAHVGAGLCASHYYAENAQKWLTQADLIYDPGTYRESIGLVDAIEDGGPCTFALGYEPDGDLIIMSKDGDVGVGVKMWHVTWCGEKVKSELKWNDNRIRTFAHVVQTGFTKVQIETAWAQPTARGFVDALLGRVGLAPTVPVPPMLLALECPDAELVPLSRTELVDGLYLSSADATQKLSETTSLLTVVGGRVSHLFPGLDLPHDRAGCTFAEAAAGGFGFDGSGKAYRLMDLPNDPDLLARLFTPDGSALDKVRLVRAWVNPVKEFSMALKAFAGDAAPNVDTIAAFADCNDTNVETEAWLPMADGQIWVWGDKQIATDSDAVGVRERLAILRRFCLVARDAVSIGIHAETWTGRVGATEIDFSRGAESAVEWGEHADDLWTEKASLAVVVKDHSSLVGARTWQAAARWVLHGVAWLSECDSLNPNEVARAKIAWRARAAATLRDQRIDAVVPAWAPEVGIRIAVR